MATERKDSNFISFSGNDRSRRSWTAVRMEMDDISVPLVLLKLAEFNLLFKHICVTHLGNTGLNTQTFLHDLTIMY